MDLFLDNIIFNLQQSGGISVYWYEIIKRLLLNSSFNIKFIEKNGVEKNLFRKNLLINSNKIDVINSVLPLSIQRILPVKINYQNKFIFHSSYYRISNNPLAINVVTLHDFIDKYYPSGIRKKVHLKQIENSLIKANGIICISKNTKNDLLKYYPKLENKTIKVIYNGVGDEFFVLDNIILPEKYSFLSTKKYILFIGRRNDSYKNFKLAVNSLKDLTEFNLLLVGGGQLTTKETEFLNKLIPNRYFLITNVSNIDLNIIYNNAFCLLYPSLYEGFGLPILEAMKAGCPVITTNKSSLPEIAGEAALFIEPINEESIIKNIRLLLDLTFRENLIKKGIIQSSKFSWDKTVDLLTELYNIILK